MIDPKDISVVIQGTNVKNATSKCIKSIRKYLPGATIIFSTYKNHNVDGLDYDVLVESDDPGATLIYKKWYNQTNRILVTSKAGLDAVKTKYVIRMRSDLIFTNSKILNDIAKQFPKRDKKYSIFKERVLFYSLWNRYEEHINRDTIVKRPFCLGDWFCFGLTEDVKNYYNCPLTYEPGFTKYFDKNKDFFGAVVCDATWAMPPEQWVAMNFFSRYFPEAKMKDMFDYDSDKVELSANLLVNNIVSVGYREIGVYIQKYPYKKVAKNMHKLIFFIKNHDWLSGVYTYDYFVKQYDKYNYLSDDEQSHKAELKLKNLRYHFSNHIIYVMKPIVSLSKIHHWFGDVLSIFWYGALIIKHKIQNKKKRL